MGDDYKGHSVKVGVYSVKDDLISNVSPFVKFVARCMIHNECAGFISKSDANKASEDTKSYCSGCGWDGKEDSVLILQYGLVWRDIFLSPEPAPKAALRPPIKTGEPIEHPAWIEAHRRRNDRDMLQCMACGTKTRKRWAVSDGHEWLFNGHPVIGDLVRIACSAGCVKSLHPDRIKSKWKAQEIPGGLS